jgi:hypothetical protein
MKSSALKCLPFLLFLLTCFFNIHETRAQNKKPNAESYNDEDGDDSGEDEDDEPSDDDGEEDDHEDADRRNPLKKHKGGAKAPAAPAAPAEAGSHTP